MLIDRMTDFALVFGYDYRVDPDSTLHKDLMQLRGQEGTDHVSLNMTFTVSSNKLLIVESCI